MAEDFFAAVFPKMRNLPGSAQNLQRTGCTYGYLYFVLKSQDYALVAGTAALFTALALVMFCTRRINWYSLEMNAPVPTASGQ